MEIGPPGQAVAYLAQDFYADGWLSFWLFVESNGQPHLQRGGTDLVGNVDPCQETSDADSPILNF